VHIYADTANLDDIERLNEHPWITGFTTNPTLFAREKSISASRHAREIMNLVPNKPVSIDGPPVAVWDLAPNTIAKVYSMDHPDVVRGDRGRINLTGVCYARQMHAAQYDLQQRDIVSVFAGRIMDTGRDPVPIINGVRERVPRVPILWASCRELYHLRMAEAAGCDIITVPPGLIDKMAMWWGMPLEAVAELTLEQFRDDTAEW